jgi:hypothetical protein
MSGAIIHGVDSVAIMMFSNHDHLIKITMNQRSNIKHARVIFGSRFGS